MLIYMLLNEGTDLVYVGKTVGTLDERWKGHVKAAQNGSSAPLHCATREWGTKPWTRVVLQHCENESELATAEENWIEYTSARDPSMCAITSLSPAKACTHP